MRAKKFGTPLSTEMKKVARAERFGLNKSITPSEVCIVFFFDKLLLYKKINS